MPVDLDKKNGDYGCKRVKQKNDQGRYEYVCKRDTKKYRITPESYGESDIFERVDHRLISDETSGTFLNFKSAKLKLTGSGFFFSDSNKLNRVEVYFSSINPETPLILGVITNASRYYTCNSLRSQRGEISNKGKAFTPENLLDKLISENNKLNNVLTYRLEKTIIGDKNYDGVDVNKVNHPSFEKYKHTPKQSENTPAAYVLYKGNQIVLEIKSEFKGQPKLDNIQQKCYTELTVYYFNSPDKKIPTSELPIFLELKEKSQTSEGVNDTQFNTYYLQRTGDTWTKWKQVEDPDLDNVITYLIDKKPNQTELYNENSIEVTKKEHNSFNLYEHTPQGTPSDKKAYLFCNFEFLVLQETNLKDASKLKNIHLRKYSKVLVYYFKSETNAYNTEIPTYLELTGQGGSKDNSQKYYLLRTDGVGIEWKQINSTDLTNTITYFLEHKQYTSYNNSSVTVSKGNHVSFDVYTHTPKEEKKLGLLLYNFNLLVLIQNKELPKGVQKLIDLNGKIYHEVSIYHFKLSQIQSVNPPKYLKLTTKETASENSQHEETCIQCKTYYLEKDGYTPLFWKQIEDPKLENLITYLLDKTETITYNDSVTVEEKIYQSFKVITHSPVTQHENKTAILRYNDHDLELISNDYFETKVERLKDFNWHVYCIVSLYYYNSRDQPLPTFLELKVKGTGDCPSEDQHECTNSNGSKCYLLQRADNEGVKWKQIDYQDLRKTVTYQLEFTNNSKSYNTNIVTVSKSTEGSFDKYTHILNEQNKFGLFLYNWQKLTLQPNDSFTGTQLEKLHGKNYLSVITYYPKDITNKPPVFLDLKISATTSGTNPDYFLQRIDQHGLLWNQITKIKLSDAITYKLQEKEKPGSYNNISVSKEYKVDKRINIYTHKTSDNEKKALFLYGYNLIFLERVDEYQGENKISEIQNVCYSEVKVIYTDKPGSGIDNTIPILIELTKKNDTSETTTNTICVLRRIDDKGFKWAQTHQTVQGLTSHLVATIAEKIIYDSKCSIIVELNRKGFYEIYLIANYEKGVNSKRKVNENMVARKQILSNSKYVYYSHNLSTSSITSEMVSVVGLRTYIGNTEIKMYDTGQKKQNFKYNPTRDSKKLDAYFYQTDDFPLMVSYDNKYFIPRTKDEYLEKWNEKTGIRSSDTDTQKNELDKINKIFNEILLDTTDPQGYGITAPSNVKTLSGFDTTRITVNPETVKEKFGKVTHKTKNESSIGIIKFGEHELLDITNNKLSEEVLKDPGLKSFIVSSVSAYYHLSDKTFNTPLLLGFTKFGGNRIEAFYERLQLTENSQWKKIEGPDLQQLRQGDDKIAEKIKSIHYTIGKSIVIKVDQQVQGESGNYKVQLVENKDSGIDPTEVSGEQMIQVTKNGCSTTKVTNYTCYKHKIPDIPKSEYVSGLKFYICTSIYLETTTGTSTPLLIHYDPDKRNVKVYFYQVTATSGTSNEQLDKVPLLVEYDRTHYRPSSRDGYFKTWIEVKVSEQTRGDALEKGKPLQEVLDGINKDLNTIELDKTGNGDSGTDSYGIKQPKPSESLNCSSTTPISTFCNRVTVKRETDGYGAKFYRKVTHSTQNKGPIGTFIHNEKIDRIKTDELENCCNKVEVFYLIGDTNYKKPLLLCITSQTKETVPECKKWFSRMGVDIKLWNNEDEEDKKFGDDSKIKAELDKINARMSNYLYLEINKKSQYSAHLQKGSDSESNNKQSIGNIDVSAEYGQSQFKPDNYRYYKHVLSTYYTTNNSNIVSQLKLQEQGDDLTLQVRLQLVNNNFLGLLGTDGKSELTNPLVYGKDQSGSEDFDPYVYFFESTSRIEDKVPLLLKFGDTYFGPKDITSYFNTWQQYDITTYSSLRAEKDKIKATLNHITRLLNEIKLEQTGTTVRDYGDIEPTGDRSNPLGANKRVSVTRNTGSKDYNTVTHSTSDTGCVGYVYYGGQELQIVGDTDGVSKNWSEAIEKELSKTPTAIYNDLTAYYHHSDNECTKPLLIGITGTGTGTTNLHYKRKELGDNYKWVKVTGDLKGHQITDKVNQIYYGFTKSVTIQLEKRPTNGDSSSKQYPLKVVENGQQDTPSQSGSENIGLSAFKCLFDTSYICIKHTINLDNKTKESDIGGLRLYLGDKEVQTFDTSGSPKKPVFYYQGKHEVHVYFYSRTVNGRGTNTHRLDKPPLLFGYNGQYYRPYSFDQYSDKWVYVNVITGRDEPQQTKQLTSELDSINKTLNRINLDNIATIWDITGTVSTDSNNTCRKKYGIPYPGKDPPGGGVDKNFYERICVMACVTTNYRKQVHTTLNKYQVGGVYLHGKQVSGIEPQSKHNQVEVYYDPGDHHFSRPLLIKLTRQDGQKEQSPTTPKALYKRGDLGGTKWETVGDDETSSYGSQDESFKDEIGKIASQLYTTLSVELEKKKQYNKGVWFKSGMETKSYLKVEKNCSTTTAPNVPSDYQCCEHKLSEYYSAIKRGALGQPPPADPTLVLEPEIAGIKLGLCTKEDKVAPLLTYTNADANTHKRNLAVYFSKGDGGVDSGVDSGDPVPLMFNFNEKFYGPISKEKYFWNWRELGINSTVVRAGTTDLKQKLDEIHEMLNGIELWQTSSYGIRCCLTHQYYYKQGGFNSKRVTVTKYTNTNKSYTMYLHNTVHKNKIGKITHSNNTYDFIQHTGQLGDKKVDQVVVIYKASGTYTSTEEPVLVLLNESNQGDSDSGDIDPITQSTTYGYYYTNEIRGDTVTEYLYHPIKDGCKMMPKLIGQGSEDGGDDDCVQQQTTSIGETWSQITGTQKMTKESPSPESDQDTSSCTGPILNELKKGSCEPGKGEDSPDSGDLLQMEESQEDRTKASLGGDGRGEPGGMGAGVKPGQTPQGPSGPAGPTGTREDTGRRGDAGAPGTEQQSTLQAQTELSGSRSSPSPDLGHTTSRNGRTTQEHQHSGGDGNNGSTDGGVASPSAKGKNGDRGEAGAQTGSEGGLNAKKVLEFLETPAGYGSTSAVGGVGVIATVGGVLLF